MKPEDLNPEYNEMEVRITALLLGELTAEEAAEVQAAIAQDPELQRLHDRLKAVLGLVREAVPTTELPVGVTPEPLTLAHERREELLAVFKGGAPKAKEPKVIKVSFWRRYQKDLMKLAAMAMLPFFGTIWLALNMREKDSVKVGDTEETISNGRGFFSLFSSDSDYTATPPPPPASAALALEEAQSQLVAQMVTSSNPYARSVAEEAGVVRSTNYLAFAAPSAAPSGVRSITVLPDLKESVTAAAEGIQFSASAYYAENNNPQVQLSSRTPSPGERPLNRARSVGGDISFRQRIVVPGTPPPATAAVPPVHSARGVPLGTPAPSQPVGNTPMRSLHIALPKAEAEMAQITDLSDNHFGANVQNGRRISGGGDEKGGQVAQAGGAGGMGGGAAAGTTHWGFQQQEFLAASATYEKATRDAIPALSGSQSQLFTFGSGNQGVANFTTPQSGNYNTQSGQNALGLNVKDKVPALGTLPVTGGLFAGGDLGGGFKPSEPIELGLQEHRALADGSTVQRMDGERFYRETAPAPSKPVTATASDKVDAWRKAREESLSELRAAEMKPSEKEGATVLSADAVARVDINRKGLADPAGVVKGLPQTLPAADKPSTPVSGRRDFSGSFGPNPSLPSLQAGTEFDAMGRTVSAADRLSIVNGTTMEKNSVAGKGVSDLTYTHFSEAPNDVKLRFAAPAAANVPGQAPSPSSVRVGKRLELGDEQKQAWFGNAVGSGGVVRDEYEGAKNSGSLQFSLPANSPSGFPQHSGTNKFVGRYAWTVVPEGTTLDLKSMRDGLTDAPSTTDGELAEDLRQKVRIGGQMSSGQAGQFGAIIPNQGNAQGVNGPVTDFGTRAKVAQSGKDFDADYIDGHAEKLMKQSGDRLGAAVTDGRKFSDPVAKMDGFNLDVIDLTVAKSLDEAEWASGVNAGMKLSEPTPVVAVDLKPTAEEAAKRQATETLMGEVSARAEVLKREGNLAEAERLELEAQKLGRRLAGSTTGLPSATKGNKEEVTKQMQDAKLLYELRKPEEAEAKLREVIKQDPANSAAYYYMNLLQEAKYGDLARKRDFEQRTRIVDVEKAWEIPTTGEALAAANPYVRTNVAQATTKSRSMLPAMEEVTEDKESKLPKAPVVGEELAKLSDENKPVVALKQVADQKEEVKAEVKKAAKEEDVAAKKPAPAPPGIPQPEVSTAENAFSTFSLNVSDVSFKLAAASLEKGLMPEVGSVRTEEFINAFNYHDPEPTSGSRVSFAWERARYPFAHDRDLVRFSVQTAAVGREPGKPLNIVLLLDNSGSMERADRLRIRQECLRVLASQLQPQDKVSVVSFARTARLWVDGLTGAQVKELPERVGNLTPEGGTNLEAAMDLAYQTVQKHFAPQGVNRVVLLTDGAANLGDVQPESLKKKVVAYRQQGVALDCFGIGWEGYNDDLLEALSRNGDGRYGFVNSPEAATTEFAAQLSGALKVAASDVKVQVEWNPKRVTVFRQLGYAKHQLKKEEFRDNTVDAAEIGAAEAGNALYTVQVNAAGEGPLGVVRVRYRLPGTDDYREQEWPLAYDGAAKDMQQASVPLRLAGTASAFSEWLVSSPYAGEVTPERLVVQMAGVPEAYPADPRPKQLEWMIRQAKSLSGR